QESGRITERRCGGGIQGVWTMRPAPVAFALLLAATTAFGADIPLSRTHYERAVALAKLGEHRGAIDEFEAAFKASPKPGLLYNIAHEYRLVAEAGGVDDMRQAIAYYRRYLGALPDA